MSTIIRSEGSAVRKRRHFSAMRRNEAIAGYLFMLPLLLAYLGIGVLIGVFGGLNAIRNYLKV